MRTAVLLVALLVILGSGCGGLGFDPRTYSLHHDLGGGPALPQSALEPTESVHRSAPVEEPVVPAEPLEPPKCEPLQKSDGTPVTLGVGSIVNSLDGTEESFSLAEYLRFHPLRVGERCLVPRLVDHPSEADFAVSGTVAGALVYEHWFEHKVAYNLSTGIGYSIGGALALGGVIGFGVGYNRMGAGLMVPGVLLTAGAGLTQYLLWKNAEPNHFRWELKTELWFWRGGKKEQAIALERAGSRDAREGLERFRRVASWDLWQPVGERLGQLVLAGGGR